MSDGLETLTGEAVCDTVRTGGGTEEGRGLAVSCAYVKTSVLKSGSSLLAGEGGSGGPLEPGAGGGGSAAPTALQPALGAAK